MKYHCNSVQKRRYSHLLRYSKTSLSLQCSLFQVLPSPCFHLTGSPSWQQMSFRSPRLPDKAHKDWCAFCLENNMKDQDGFALHTYRQTDHATDNTDLETFCNKWTGEINLVHRWWVDALLDIIHLGSPSAKNDSLLKTWSIWSCGFIWFLWLRSCKNSWATNLSTYNLNTMFVSTEKVYKKGSKNDRSYRSNSWHPEILLIPFPLSIWNIITKL